MRYTLKSLRVRDILESIVSEIVCRGVDDNVPDEVHEVHMQDDRHGQGVEEHHDQHMAYIVEVVN